MSEVPNLVVQPHLHNFSKLKRNFCMAANLNNAALANDDLLKISAISEFNRNDVISRSRFTLLFQIVDIFQRYWN